MSGCLSSSQRVLFGEWCRCLLVARRPSCVSVEVGLSPFEGELGFRILRKGGGKSGQDAGVPVQAGAHEVEEDCLDLSFAADG